MLTPSAFIFWLYSSLFFLPAAPSAPPSPVPVRSVQDASPYLPVGGPGAATGTRGRRRSLSLLRTYRGQKTSPIGYPAPAPTVLAQNAPLFHYGIPDSGGNLSVAGAAKMYPVLGKVSAQRFRIRAPLPATQYGL